MVDCCKHFRTKPSILDIFDGFFREMRRIQVELKWPASVGL